MSGEQPDNSADGTEKGATNPLEDLLVEEISEEARADMAEALDGLVGITREEYVITLQGGLDALPLQHRVVAYLLASCACDLLAHGHVTGTSNRVDTDTLGEELGVHPADVSDAALGHGDLRHFGVTGEVQLPYERVRHAARSVTRQLKEPLDVDSTASSEDYTLSTQSDADTAMTGADQDDVEAAVTSADADGTDGGDEGGG